MSASIELAPGTDFAGYRIVSLLGRGGMSVVYLAEHLGLERRVAIKVLLPALAEDARFRDRFVRESRMAASLDHPNVIPIYEAGEADGRLFIAMRYVEGTDLKDLIHEFGPLGPGEAASVIRQMAGALDAAHARGLVHRDVKPANVLIARTSDSRDGQHVYLSDFGLTKRTSSESGITGTGQFVGTLDYAAPEQFEGKPLDARTDVYSLGCVLYECLAGHAPFRKEFDAALMYAHLSEAPPKPSAGRGDLPPAIDDVVARGMAKEPDDRYQSAGEMAAAADAALGFETSPSAARARPLRRRSRRRPALLAAVALVVVAALLAVLLPQLLGGNGPTAQAATPPGMAIVAAADGHRTAFIPLSTVRSPVEAIYAEGHYWVLNLNPVSFVEIDPRKGRILRQIASPTGDIGYFTVSGNTLWVTDHNKPIVYAVNVNTQGSSERFTVPGEQYGLAWPAIAFGSVWVGTQDGKLFRLDPSNGDVQKRFGGLGSTYGVARGEGAIWTAGDQGMNRIDPRNNDVTRIDSAHSSGGYVAVGGGFAWVTDEFKGVVYKVDDTGTLVDTYATGEGARTVSYSDGKLWVGNQDAGTVTAIDAVTGSSRTYRFDHPIQAIAAGSGSVLIQLNEGRTYEDRIDSLRGSVARLLVQGYQLDTDDPALVWNPFGFEIENATCAPLLGYPDSESRGEAALRPEVAASMPDVSPDGRTYRISVRPGFRFSPPSNQPVTAETYRFSIERALSPNLGDQTPGSIIVPDIAGEDAFLAGKADHVSGLRASGDMLTITLSKPSPDFLARLASPFFCPVPTDSTPVRGGAVVNLGGSAGRDMVPAAGPYYIADHLNGEYIILKRNPNYGGTRPQRFDAIAMREGIDPGEAVARVEKGSWDGIVNMYDPILAPDGAVAEQFGSGGPGPAYVHSPDGWSFTVALNASGPLLSDPAVRRAVAYALDRPTLARSQAASAPADGVVPTAQVVAPNLPGVPSESPYPADGPDLTKAKHLMHGRSGTVALAFSSGCLCEQAAEGIRSELRPIGISVQLKPVDDSYAAIHDHPERYDIKVLGAVPDYPSTASYVLTVFGDYIPAEWLPHAIRRGLDELRAAPAETREEEAAAFLAGPVTDEVPATGIGYSVAAAFLSPRLGCRVFPPFFSGPDLAALCPAGTGSGE